MVLEVCFTGLPVSYRGAFCHSAAPVYKLATARPATEPRFRLAKPLLVDSSGHCQRRDLQRIDPAYPRRWSPAKTLGKSIRPSPGIRDARPERVTEIAGVVLDVDVATRLPEDVVCERSFELAVEGEELRVESH